MTIRLSVPRFLLLVALAAWAMIAWAAVAHAAEASASNVVLTEITQYAIGLFLAAVASLLYWGVSYLVKKIKGEVTAQDQAQINMLIQLGLQWSSGKLGDLIREKGWDHWTTQSTLLAEALKYVNTAAPDLLKRQGLDDERVREMILARLPALTPPVTTISTPPSSSPGSATAPAPA